MSFLLILIPSSLPVAALFLASVCPLPSMAPKDERVLFPVVECSLNLTEHSSGRPAACVSGRSLTPMSFSSYWNRNRKKQVPVSIVDEMKPIFSLYNVFENICIGGTVEPVLRSRSRWSRNYLGPGPGAEIKFLINIFCSQLRGCYDEDKLISTSISIVLLF